MLRSLATVARFTAVEAVHTRFGWLLAAIVLLAFSLVQFIAQLAVTETREIQVALLAASFRLTVVFLIGLFVITGITRECSDKRVELRSSLPLSRGGYYLGKFAGYALVCLVSVLPLALLLALFTTQGASILWGASLFLELLIVCAASLLFGFAFGQVTPAFSALVGFYLISRTIASIQLMADGALAGTGSFSQAVMIRLVDGLAYLLPDLDQFTRTAWVVYPPAHWPELLIPAGQTLIYVLLLTGIGLFNVYRRER
jgi:ABC-type transport system involved in multi-copper enzyme maturation permease subunit